MSFYNSYKWCFKKLKWFIICSFRSSAWMVTFIWFSNTDRPHLLHDCCTVLFRMYESHFISRLPIDGCFVCVQFLTVKVSNSAMKASSIAGTDSLLCQRTCMLRFLDHLSCATLKFFLYSPSNKIQALEADCPDLKTNSFELMTLWSWALFFTCMPSLSVMKWW